MSTKSSSRAPSVRPSAPPRPATDLPSLPPRVPGPVRYYVTVKCHKILWNSTGHSLLKRAAQTEERQAKVELRWWGEDEGILLNPLNVSLKSPSSPASPKTLKDRKTTVKYAVKCYKKQLATYLSDMGPLALPITLNDLTIGTASVGPFESIVNEPYRAHNAFYPIVQSPSSFMSPTSSSASIDESGGKPPKVIGELHFVMEMEDVTTATKAKEEKGTSTLKQNLKQITPSKNSSKFRKSDLKNQNIKPAEDDKENQMEALEDYAPRPQPPVPTTSKGLIDLVFDSIDDPFKSPNVSRLVNVEHLDESPQMSKIPVATTKAPSAPLSILDDIVSKAATLKHSIDQSLKASQPLHSSESLPQPFPLSAKKGESPKQLHVILDSDSLSDEDLLMMDDDLIIQALNDKVLDPLSRTNPYLEEDSESQADRTMLKSYELDYASDDEMKSRIAARLQSKTEESTKIAISGLTSSHLSINAITKLGRIHSLHVLIPTFQPSTVVSSLVYKIEINIPNTLKGNPFRMETLSKYKNHRFQLSQESKDEKIDVDLEGACPMHFDEDLIHHWMTQSIQFKITATYPSLKKDNRSHSEPEWKGTGKIDCKTLLGSFKFEGRIPIWNTSDKITQRLVGSLEVRLELVAESADIPMRTEVQIPSKQHAPVEEDSTVPKNTVLELPKLSNLYLYMHASTLRSQALSHISGSETVFVYLTVRLSPFSQPLETPPVILNPTFDSNTGKIMPPTDLKFHFTLPLVIQKGSDPSSYAPFIIEVWSLIGGSTSVSSSTSKQTHEGGPALLGLVKVPFQYLLSMALSEDKFLPVVLPDTEYVTMNPFTGFSVGWLKATLALGNLSDVTLFRKQREILSNETQPVQTEKPESARNVVEPERGSGSFKDEDVSRLRKIEALLEAQVAQALSPKRKEAKKRVAEDFRELDSQVVLSVGILKACGLQPLLLQAKNSLLSGSSLEDASELGANARVRLTVFPMGEDGTEDESVVETPISTNSFCPTFNHHVELTLAGLDTELIAWIRNGGSARGEIWHHVSSDLKATYSTEDVLLGEFEVPLGSLLTSRKGVNQEWFQVFSTNSGEAMGAIQISLAFGEGCNLGALSLFSSGIYSFNVDLSVKKVEIMKERDTAPDISSVIVRGSIPSRARSSEDIDYESFSSHPCRWTVTEDSQVAKISYSRLLTFCLDHTMKDVFESTTLALEFDVINETGLAKRLGGVSIDILGLLSQSRPSHKRMSEFLLKTSKNYIIVDEASADLCGARVQIELCVSRCKSISNGPQRVIDSRQRSEIKSQPGPRSASIPLRFFTTEETSPKIDLRIRIERAMHIPLTRDSFIDASPLAQSKGDQLAPLSALVTFDWIFDSVFQPSFSTRAIPFQKCPSWNEDFAVHLAKSPSSLDKLRQQSKITFKVWNAKSGLSQAVSEKGLDTSKELLGEVTVDLSSLFLGLDQISGWFPIRDNRDNNRGQLMVQIFSSESLKSAFKSLVHREPLMLRDKHHVFTHSTQFPFTADTKLSEKVCRNRASLYISNQPLSQSHNVDTWVWSGSKWEHRSVNKALTSKSETSGALGQSVFQKTVNELDHLQSKLRSLSLNPQQLSMPLPKTADNMITSLLPLPREDDPISELERMDKILRISRSWSPEPARDETALEPLTFEELVSVPELKSDDIFQVNQSFHTTPQDEIVVFKGLKPLDPISRQLRVEGRKFAEEEDEEEDGEIYEELARRRVKAAKAPNPTIDGTSSNAQDSDPINLAKTGCVVPSARLKDDRLLPY